MRVELRIVQSRAHARTSVLLRSEVRTAAGETAGIVRNISASGACLSVGDVEPCPGEPINLTLRHIGQVRGTISWARSGRIGVTFDQPIDPCQVLRRAA